MSLTARFSSHVRALPRSLPHRHGVNYDLNLPLQNTETGHIQLIVKKVRSSDEAGTRFDKMLKEAKNMLRAVEAVRTSRHEMILEEAKTKVLKADSRRFQKLRRASVAIGHTMSLNLSPGVSPSERAVNQAVDLADEMIAEEKCRKETEMVAIGNPQEDSRESSAVVLDVAPETQ